MRPILVVLVFAVGGCGVSGGSFAQKPGQAQAVDLVWRQYYGEKGSPPEVEWVNEKSLWGDIVGFTYAGWKVVVAADDAEICGADGCGDAYRFSSTAMAHEFMHYRTWLRTGDVDPLHYRGDWGLALDTNQALFENEEQERESQP
jgi:hypothetical protein